MRLLTMKYVERFVYDRLQRRVEKITSGYSTRELREFVCNELGKKIYRGARPEYITSNARRMG